MKEFVDYVIEFYGANGIYDMGATRKEIMMATGVRMGICKHSDIPFEGDTIDREAVRDIITDMRIGLAA